MLCAVKRSADLALLPDTLTSHDDENVPQQQLAAGGGSVLPSAAVTPAASCAYTPPYAYPACTVQTARRLLPGQPLPHGVAAFGMAMPAQQPQQ